MGSGATSTLMRWHVVLLAFVAFLGLQARGFAQATDEPGREAAPTLSLSQSQGRPGLKVEASGEGYCGSVILRWDGELRLESGESGERGDVSITFTVPRYAAPGWHTVTSTSECGGARASFEVVILSSRFRIIRPPTEPASPSTEPAPPPTEPAPPSTEPVPPSREPVPPSTEPVFPLPAHSSSAAPGVLLPTSGGALDSYKGSTVAQLDDTRERELESGVILYNPPEHMRVGVVNRVEVRISREVSDKLAEGLQGKADPRVERLRVGTTMRAKLEGSAFDIILIGSDVQLLGSTGFREWRWDVMPTVSGTHSLAFTVSVLYEKYSNPIEEKVLERRIDVAVNPGYSLSKWLSNNWEKLVAALVAIIGIIEGCRRLRLRRTDDRSGGVAPDRGRALRNIRGRSRVGNRP
jgi:hypothetical protein